MKLIQLTQLMQQMQQMQQQQPPAALGQPPADCLVRLTPIEQNKDHVPPEPMRR